MTISTDLSGEIRLSIVIAVFNEENNLSALIGEINSVCDARGWSNRRQSWTGRRLPLLC
jgi:hypothetical protein